MNWLDRFVLWSLSRKWLVCGAATVLFALSAFFALKLDLKADLIELLPTDSPSVVNLEKMKQRVASYTTLTIAVESPDLEASMRFVDDLVEELHRFPPEQIKFVDYNLRELRDFYDRNKWLYADLKDLEEFRDRLRKRIQEETEAAVVESLDEEPPPKTDLRIEELKAKYNKKTESQDRFPKGYYVTPDRTITAVFVRPPPSAANFADSARLVEDIQRVVDRLDPQKYHKDMTVGFTGDVKTALEEREALAADMRFISIVCMIGILGVIIAYYRSIRSVVIVGLPMLLGLAMSFALAYFVIGYLNSATAFLSSIVAGNGINFMIILLARFYEELRARGQEGFNEAMKVAVRGSVRGTIVASLAASIAYGSLMLAGFRGFRQFGIIGGAGMLLCWVSTFATGPALIAVVNTLKQLDPGKKRGHPIAAAFGRLVVRRPRAILLASLIITAVSVLVTIPYAFDPFEYDFHNLRNRESVERGSAQLSNRVSTMFDIELDVPTPIIVERVEDVPTVKKAIMESIGAVAVIGDAKTLFDFLPKDQGPKLSVLKEIRELIDRKIDFLDPDDRKTVMEYRPPESLREIGLDDIPEVVARPYTEQDGTRGRIIYVYAHKDESLLNGKYLLKLARYLRNIHVEGAEITIIGQPMLFADMITSIVHDGVLVTIAACIGVLLLVILAFRSWLGVFAVLMPVIMGLLWMIGCAAALDMKLNFLNFVVIPITLGIAVDYGANIFARYRIEPHGSVARIVEYTGGAVMLESLTTIIGYATLITSTNMALQSFGIVADIGEVTCIVTAGLVMTAFLAWWESGRRAHSEVKR